MGRAHLHPLHIQLANGNAGSSSSASGFFNGNGSNTVHQPNNHGSHGISPLRLTPRDESTRVQLQKQRLQEQQRAATAALVSRNIPGLRTSAAFFGSLRTNLRLHASPPASPISTPPSMRGSTSSLPPPSPLSQPVDSPMMGPSDPTPAEDPLAGVPELRTYVTTDDEEKTAGLRLVADSVAQMRQTANSILVSHPVNLAVIGVVLALVGRYIYETKRDVFLTGTTCAGVLMTTFALCRWYTQGYIFMAEGVNWEWLGDADLIVTKFGDEIIGALVIDWISGESRQKRKKAWRGEIRAWTVRMKYRGKGVGTALLEEVVKEARKKGAESVEFSDEHANSKRVMPSFYNGPFDKRERKGRELLADLFEASPTRGKRR